MLTIGKEHETIIKKVVDFSGYQELQVDSAKESDLAAIANETIAAVIISINAETLNQLAQVIKTFSSSAVIGISNDKSLSIKAYELGITDLIHLPLQEHVLSLMLGNHITTQQNKLQIENLRESLEAEKRKVTEERKLLSKYISTNLIEAITSGKVAPKIGGHTPDLSVLFCNLRNAEKIIHSIEYSEIAHYLSEFFADLFDLIEGRGGSVNNFSGSWFVATFGAPTPTDENALACVSTALTIRDHIQQFNEVSEYEPVSVSQGLATGKAFVGNIGSVNRLNYTVLGDPANLSARLSSLAAKNHQDILIDGRTFDEAQESIICDLIDHDTVKGKLKKVRIYELKGRK